MQLYRASDRNIPIGVAADHFLQGNEAWVENLENKFHKEFKAAPPIPWVIDRSGRVAGEVRAAGGGGFGAGNVTFVNVYEAGFVIHMGACILWANWIASFRHMVPHDQSEAALVSSPVLRQEQTRSPIPKGHVYEVDT